MKLVIWMNMPSHHQSAFFEALRQDPAIDLAVRYYGSVSEERIRLGWQRPERLPDGELAVVPELKALRTIPDWKQRIHLIEARYGFRRRLTDHFSTAGVHWIHWGERGEPGWRGWLHCPYWRRFGHKVNRHALGAFATGSLAAEDFQRWGIPGPRVAHLHYATAPLDSTTPPDPEIAQFSAGRRVFLYCGELAIHKGTDVLLHAFASLRCEQWVLVLVGSGRDLSRYRKLARHLGIHRRTLFRGILPSPAIAAAMVQACVFVLPSRYDGWGVVLNEAASLGKPLIATANCGAAYHLIDPGGNGYRVVAGSRAELAGAMNAYVVEPELAAAHGRHSLRIFEQYRPQRNVTRLKNAITTWDSPDCKS